MPKQPMSVHIHQHHLSSVCKSSSQGTLWSGGSKWIMVMGIGCYKQKRLTWYCPIFTLIKWDQVGSGNMNASACCAARGCLLCACMYKSNTNANLRCWQKLCCPFLYLHCAFCFGPAIVGQRQKSAIKSKLTRQGSHIHTKPVQCGSFLSIFLLPFWECVWPCGVMWEMEPTSVLLIYFLSLFSAQHKCALCQLNRWFVKLSQKNKNGCWVQSKLHYFM